MLKPSDVGAVTPQELSLKWFMVGRYDDFPVNMGKTVRADGLELAVFRLDGGQIRAIQNRCPHKHGVLAEGIVCGGHVFCPMHDRRIELRSGEVQAPDTGCVAVYPVKVVERQIYVALAAAIDEKAG